MSPPRATVVAAYQAEVQSTAHCKPKCLGLLVFSRFLAFDRLVQLLVLVIHRLPFGSLRTLENGLTHGMPVLIHERRPHLLSPTSVVSMKVRNIPSSSPRHSFSSSAPSRTTASRKSMVKFTTGLNSTFFSKSPTSTGAWYHDEPSEPIHHLEPTFLWKAAYHHVIQAVTIFLLVCQKFERVDHFVTDSVWRRVCSKHFYFSAVRQADTDGSEGTSTTV